MRFADFKSTVRRDLVRPLQRTVATRLSSAGLHTSSIAPDESFHRVQQRDT
jgi:hypothetical protein